MSEPFGRLRRFLRELKRRKVYRVAAGYLVAAFVVLQLAGLAAGAFGFPGWFEPMVWVLAGLGFPIAVVLAWAFEVTPEGVRRTPEAEPTEEAAAEAAPALSTGYKVLVALGLVAAAVAGGWYLTGGGGSEPDVTNRSIAVLPFENMGGQQSAQLSMGVHDGLLTRLSNISDLQVISRTSVMQYEDTDKTVPQIARELGATWVVEGAVQQAGGQVQVNAQLIKAPEDAHQWAQSYNRKLNTDNLFAIQSELTKKIARSLEAQVTSSERARIERQPTGELEAYRLYVQGRTHLDQRTEQGMRRGMRSFEQAIAEDSTYALAWSGLADARTLLASYGHAPQDSLLLRARRAAERALELQPDLAEAHASLGLVRQDLERDGPGALRKFRRAVELKPSYARAHHWLGNLLETLGQHERAGAPLRRAADLDPMSPPIRVTLSGWYYHADSLQHALEEARRTRELSPGYPSGPLYEAIVLSRLGRQEQAITALQRVLNETDPESETQNGARAWLAIAHHRAGDTARARSLLDRLETERAEFAAAAVRAEMGDQDAALSWLSGTSFDYVRTAFLRYDSIFDPLRDDSRFRKLIRKVNRSWGLNPDGSLPDSVDVSFEAESND